MFPITITIHDQAQLNIVAAALSGQAKEPATAPKPAATPAAAAGPATAPAAEAAAPAKTASAPSPAAASAAADAQASTAATDAKAPTYEEVKPLILDLTKAKGRDVAAAALAKFGAAKGPELKPEDFAAFVAHAKALLEEALA